MATAQRRSSRLRNSGTPGKATIPNPMQSLDSVMEREGELEMERNSINALIAGTPGAYINVKTPESRQSLKPSHAEMHPEHHHQSTIKVSNAGLQLGFTDPNPYQSSPLRSSHSRVAMSSPQIANPQSSPGYQFSFNRDNQDLSEEAQRIMACVRNEAARIKEKMRQEREEQRQREAEAEEELGISGRRFAKPKSRYSDAHTAEFNKMRSIADHVSLWKNKSQSTKQPPQAAVSQPTPTSTLKRTRSKIDLPESKTPSVSPIKPTRSKVDLQASKDAPGSALKRAHSKVDLQAAKEKSALPSLKRTQSKASLYAPGKEIPKQPAVEATQLENASPAKRRKTTVAQDVSAVRPSSSSSITSKIPTLGQSGLPAAITTPTKASLARAQGGQSTSPSKLPTSTNARSRSVRNLSRTERFRSASGRLGSAIAGKVSSMKSILHRPQPKYSDDPVKIASGTHVPAPQPTPTHHDRTPSLPATPRPHHTLPRPSPKKVEFAPDTKAGSERIPSPSPIKTIPVEYPKIVPSIERSVSASPMKSPVSEPDVPTPKAAYPTPARPGSMTRHNVASLAQPLFSNPPSSRDFTFAHEKRIKFGSERDTPQSPNRGSSTSIRHVHPSGVPAPAYPSSARRQRPELANPASHLLYGVSHGIANKKRARVDEVESSDIENVDPERMDEVSNEQGSPRKRTKMSTPEVKKTPAKPASKLRRQTGVSGAQKKTGLSLARLNFLSTPKNRR